jgi:hypothetical protein
LTSPANPLHCKNNIINIIILNSQRSKLTKGIMTITELNKKTLILNKKEEEDELDDEDLESTEEKPKKGKKPNDNDDEKELDDDDEEELGLYDGEDEFYGQDLKLDSEEEEENDDF